VLFLKNGSYLPQPEVGAFRQDAKVAKKSNAYEEKDRTNQVKDYI
jgi:hypothetical protein